MTPDNPKEFMIDSLKNLLSLIENDKIRLSSIDNEVIFHPEPYQWVSRGRRVTLELHYTKNTDSLGDKENTD